MSRLTQKLGMNHIRLLKQEAIQMWKEYDEEVEMWYDCIEGVLEKHRLEMFEQFIHGDYTEQEIDRRNPEEMRLEIEADEQIQKLRDSMLVFNADSDD